jgi:hypothetical protein
VNQALTRVEAERRDRVLRAYVEDMDWDLVGETSLRRHLVQHSPQLVPAHPLLVGVEWGARSGHAGDLLFFDGERALLVIELKVIHKNDIARRLHQVDAQARDFARAARVRFPWATVEGLVYTSLEHAQGAGPRPPRENRPAPKGFMPQAEGREIE